ncbi:MAG: glycosyltransferase [Lentisphaeraceae bacterium]|nr:glycosyltransferase [Lentisphaeraceae bacterium]
MKIKIYGSELLKVHLIKSLSSSKHTIIEDGKPDLVLGLNELENTSKLSLQLKVPMAVWFTDTHKANSANFPSYLKENSYMFCFSKEQERWFKESNFKYATYLPLAVDCDVFKHLDKQHNISFMGELRNMTTDNPMVHLLHPLRSKAHLENSLGNEIRYFLKSLDHFINQASKNLTPVNFDQLYQEFSNNLPNDLKKFKDLYSMESWIPALFETVNAYQRAHICRLFKGDIRIHGTPTDWQTLGNWPNHANKRAQYPQEWAQLCGSSKISLNLFRPDPLHGIPLKAFEIAASSLLFTNDHPMLRTVFTPDKDCIAFSSLEEAKDKYTHLLNNPDLVEKISENSRKLMLEKHQYQNRWTSIKSALNKAGLISL